MFLGMPKSKIVLWPDGCSTRNDHDGSAGIYFTASKGGFMRNARGNLPMRDAVSMILTLTVVFPRGIDVGGGELDII